MIGILLMVVLIPKFGLMGVGWSYFVSTLSGTVITILIKIKFFPQKKWFNILYAVYGPIIIGFIFILVGVNIMPILTVSSWIGLIFYLAIMAVAILAILLFIDFIIFSSEKRGKFVLNVLQNSIRLVK